MSRELIVVWIFILTPLIALNVLDPLAREFWLHPSPIDGDVRGASSMASGNYRTEALSEVKP